MAERYVVFMREWGRLKWFPLAQPRRYNVDKWDERMIARDLRITGKPRHQKVLFKIRL